MDAQEFKQIIMVSGKRKLLAGTLIVAFGAFFLWLVVFGAKAETAKAGTEGLVVLWVMILFCLAFGGSMCWLGISTIRGLKSRRNGLIQAIDAGDSEYLIWFYENISGFNNGDRDYQLWAYAADGTRYQFAVKTTRISEVMDFLARQFPNAHVGYSKEVSEKIEKS